MELRVFLAAMVVELGSTVEPQITLRALVVRHRLLLRPAD
jgi:hypothetical protein